MFCTRCGTKVAEGDKYCHNCGTSLPSVISSAKHTKDSRQPGVSHNGCSTNRLRRLVVEEETDEVCAMVDKDTDILFQLADLLEDRDPQVRSRAIGMLGQAVLLHEDVYFSRLEQTVTPRILELLDDNDASVRQAAASGCVNYPSPRLCGVEKEGSELLELSVPHLASLLKDRDDQVERSAGFSLRAAAHWFLEQKKEPRVALHILGDLADHHSPRIREQVGAFWAKHASEFPETAFEARPVLVKLAQDPDDVVCQQAEKALAMLRE